jgi:hypothetical protein
VPEQLKNIRPHQWFAAGIDQSAEFAIRGQLINQFFAFIGSQFVSRRFAACGMAMDAAQVAGAPIGLKYILFNIMLII